MYNYNLTSKFNYSSSHNVSIESQIATSIYIQRVKSKGLLLKELTCDISDKVRKTAHRD
jgi:hypothetical protein